MSAIITMSFLGFWPLAIGLFPSKKSVIVAPRNNTYYQSKCLLSWVLGGNFLASEVPDLVKKLRGREDRREREGLLFSRHWPFVAILGIFCRKIESDQKKNCIQIIRINFRNNKLKMTRHVLPVIFKIVESRQSGPMKMQSFFSDQILIVPIVEESLNKGLFRM